MSSKTTALPEMLTPVDSDIIAVVDNLGVTPASQKLTFVNSWTNYYKGKADALYQPLDADLTAIAALTTSAAGRSALAIADPNADRLLGWDDSAGAVAPFALADLATEATPAAGDYVIIYGAEGDVRKADWSTLPGSAGGISNVVEDLTPQLGGQLDINGKSILWPSTVAISNFLDEDTMSSNSATAGATQQSIKAYVDAEVGTAIAQDLFGVNADRTTGAETLADTDLHSIVSMNSGSAQTLTVPADNPGTYDYPIGGLTIIRQEGGGQTTIAAGATVTIHSFGSSLASPGQHAWALLIKIAANEYICGWTAGTVNTANSPASGEFARFTGAFTIEGRTASEARTDLGLAIGTDVAAYDVDALFADVGDTLTAGFLTDSYDAGTISSGTYTPAPGTGQENIQHYTNNGAHTLAPPASPCSVVIQITNGASAGAVTTSGFTKVTGDAFTTTNGDDFICSIIKTASFSHLHVEAMQ